MSSKRAKSLEIQWTRTNEGRETKQGKGRKRLTTKNSKEIKKYEILRKSKVTLNQQDHPSTTEQTEVTRGSGDCPETDTRGH